jgi:hypothetical protein
MSTIEIKFRNFKELGNSNLGIVSTKNLEDKEELEKEKPSSNITYS